MTNIPSSLRVHPGVAVLDDEIFISGGGRHWESVIVYNCATNIWTEIASMNEGRRHSDLLVLNGFLIAVGGEDKSPIEEKEILEVYNKDKNEWNIYANLPLQNWPIRQF